MGVERMTEIDTFQGRPDVTMLHDRFQHPVFKALTIINPSLLIARVIAINLGDARLVTVRNDVILRKKELI
ncbi:hypothetical protein L195_g053474 [Trifolium pratense]|uniref:Uncharacterized protein n=1 Tax=Trifolium pratense TaxID=57577 RepID=A0A2K3KAQ2_TRIPR|nr:hypothetical protein L195_g053474 [Trifolium pratense]